MRRSPGTPQHVTGIPTQQEQATGQFVSDAKAGGMGEFVQVSIVTVVGSAADVNVGRFGNASPNTLLGPPMVNFDIGLHKQVQISEKFRVVGEATFKNALNHPVYGLPSTNIRAANAGYITSTRVGPRSLLRGIRLEF